MSAYSRIMRGDNPDDVRKLFPHAVGEIEMALKELKPKKAPKKKAAKKSES